MIECDVTLGPCRLLQGRAEEVLPTLPDASVQLIVTDPPYMGVKTSYLGQKITWDTQWNTRTAYLAWLKGLALEWRRILPPNGSVYVFASPQMAAHVEVMLEDVFHVLNHLVWIKHDGSGAGTGGHSKVCKQDLMSYFPQTERILFCEQYGSDEQAMGEAGFQEAERTLKISLFSQPIREAMQGTHTTAKEVTEAIGAYGTVNHGGAVSNWLAGSNIPTKAQYDAMRTYFNTSNGPPEYLRQEYEDLRQEYEDLRQEYEDLRQEYEDLRRPFTLTPERPYTDCFTYATVQAFPGKHPCEKPLALLRDLITTSSRPGETVLDACAGSFATLEAARQCGRRGIGIEADPHWWHQGCLRLGQETLFVQETPPPVRPKAQQLSLFAPPGTGTPG